MKLQSFCCAADTIHPPKAAYRSGFPNNDPLTATSPHKEFLRHDEQDRNPWITNENCTGHSSFEAQYKHLPGVKSNTI